MSNTRSFKEATERYRVVIEWSDEDNGYIATVPDLPGCSAWGEWREDSEQDSVDAMIAWMIAAEVAGNPIPPPT